MKTTNVILTSSLHQSYEDRLKSLLFFNPAQRKAMSGIETSIEKFGLPRINKSNDKLTVTVGNLPDVQTIFAMIKNNKVVELAGVMIFFRESKNNITLLHIAVSDEYSLSNLKGSYIITMMLVSELKKIAKRIKQIQTITILYKKDKIGKIHIR